MRTFTPGIAPAAAPVDSPQLSRLELEILKDGLLKERGKVFRGLPGHGGSAMVGSMLGIVGGAGLAFAVFSLPVLRGVGAATGVSLSFASTIAGGVFGALAGARLADHRNADAPQIREIDRRIAGIDDQLRSLPPT